MLSFDAAFDAPFGCKPYLIPSLFSSHASSPGLIPSQRPPQLVACPKKSKQTAHIPTVTPAGILSSNFPEFFVPPYRPHPSFPKASVRAPHSRSDPTSLVFLGQCISARLRVYLPTNETTFECTTSGQPRTNPLGAYSFVFGPWARPPESFLHVPSSLEPVT